ncbi:MAG: 50S ribosomal protein L6 [Candidatus Lokiarchaeota archaeon]|nr:50S ribosomal protein L6 [Candidatus Lokiarchaeota archaeon]MCK4480550.1 50S ribosomal protein L6 [Candidatus Lokiarchaeota archaeon]
MVKVAFFKEELEIPSDVKVTLEGGHHIRVKGPEGDITKDFSHIRGIKVSIDKNHIIFTTNFPKSGTLALIKTVVSIINNLIIGVQTNYKFISKICYSHFPCNCEVKSDKKEIHVVNFLGERAPRKAKYPENVRVKVESDDVYFIGPDKEALGQAAANVKRACRIRKKDPRVFQDGVYLYKKMRGDEIIWEIT